MIFVARKISKKIYDELSQQGEEAILNWGWGIIMNSGYADYEDYYEGAYIHSKDGEYEIVCKIDKEEDDLK